MKDETTYNDSTDDEKIIHDKIRVAYSKNLKVHILLKNRKGWRNGFVKNMYPDFFILIDKINGEEAFFFLEIDDVEPYMEERE